MNIPHLDRLACRLALLTLFLSFALPAWSDVPSKVFLVCVAKGADTGELPPCASTIDKPVSLAVILQTSGREPTFYGSVPKLRLGDKVVPVSPYPGRASVEIHWFKVEPQMYHVDGKGHDPANPDFLWYANAGAPGGRTDRQPLPPDTLRYVATELRVSDPWMAHADAHPSDKRYDVHEGLGTMRYTVTATGPAFRLTAPTLTEFNPDDGASEKIARVLYRANNSYLGFMTGFFNVPGVFGPYDSEITHHIGVDCSHFVVGAWREYSRKKVPFTNVTGLRTAFVHDGHLEEVSGDRYLNASGRLYETFDRKNGRLGKPVDIPIRVGDVIVFNYSTDPTRRQWDHVGVVYQDRGPDGKPSGILNGNDLIMNSGPAEPSINRLDGPEFVESSQPTRIAVLRWRTTPT